MTLPGVVTGSGRCRMSVTKQQAYTAETAEMGLTLTGANSNMNADTYREAGRHIYVQLCHLNILVMYIGIHETASVV
jgi:hypothetical protein